MLKFTYEQVLATQAEQVNSKANNIDNISDDLPSKQPERGKEAIFLKLYIKIRNKKSFF